MSHLKIYRILNGISVNTIIIKLGITRQAYYDWEREKKPCPLLRQEKISKFFEIPKQYLFPITTEEKRTSEKHLHNLLTYLLRYA